MTSTPAEPEPEPDPEAGRHVSGCPTGAESTYAGTGVVGPAADEPGATGTWVFGLAEGDVGADVAPEAPEDGAVLAAPDAPGVADGVAELFPVAALCDVDPELLDEHPAMPTMTVATATPKRFPNMLLTGITLDVHRESTLSDLPMTVSPGYSCIRTR